MSKHVCCDNNVTVNKPRLSISVEKVSAGLSTFDWSDTLESHSAFDNKSHGCKTLMRCV